MRDKAQGFQGGNEVNDIGADDNGVKSRAVALKHPGGRPKKEDREALRQVKVTIYMSQEEKDKADREARRLNIPLSTLFKLRLFKEV